MRLLLVIALLISSLPISTPRRVQAAPVFKSGAATYTNPPHEDPTPTPSPTPSPDPVLEQAERDAKLAEELKKKAVSDQERAEAEAARLKALTQPFGAPANVSVPTGSVTTDAAGWVESQMLAQEAARQITFALTTSLCKDKIIPGDPSKSDEANGDEAKGDGAKGDTPKADPIKIKTLVVYSPNDLAGVELYGSIKGQLTRLKSDLAKKKDDAVKLLSATDPTVAPGTGTTDFDPTLTFAAPGIATGVIKSVAELLNLFRTDTSFTNQAITLSESTIVSQIVRNLNMRTDDPNDGCDGTVKVYFPALYPPRLLDTSENSDIINLLDEVLTAKVEAAGNVEKLDARIKQLKELGATFESRDKKKEEEEAKKTEKTKKDEEIKKKHCEKKNTPECRKLRKESKDLDEQITQLGKDIEKLDKSLELIKADPKKFKDWIEKLTDLRAKTQALITATDLISAKLNTPDDSTKLTALAQLLRAERLHKILSQPGSYTLHVEVKANGTTKVKKNLFVDAKVRHSAGADLTYQLIEGGGVIAQAQEMKCYIEYQSARDVQNMVSGTGNSRVICKFDDSPGQTAEQNIAKDGAKNSKPDKNPKP